MIDAVVDFRFVDILYRDTKLTHITQQWQLAHVYIDKVYANQHR